MYGIYWVVLKVLKKIKDHEVTFLKRNFLKTSIYTTDAYLTASHKCLFNNKIW